VLRGLAAGALAMRASGVLAACSSGINLKGAGSFSSSGTINIGFIPPYKEIDDI
jgi:hypothetical protein